MTTAKSKLFRRLRRAIAFIEHFGAFLECKRLGMSFGLFIQFKLTPWLKRADIKTVLDIGAHTGSWARTAQYLFPDAVIYSFEPIPSSFNALKERMHRIPTHKAFNIALGEKPGEYDFNLNDFPAASSFHPVSQEHIGAFPHTANATRVRVKVERLDEFISKYDMEEKLLIKVDVQGFEDRVIAGGIETFAKASIVIIEVSFVELYEGQCLFEDIYFTLVNLGFRYSGNLDQLINPKTGRILQADAIFLNNRH